jgi:hypothetical protein
MTYFVYLDTQFASDAPSEEEAIEEVTANLIERLQRNIVARRRKEISLEGISLIDGVASLEWVVEEE